jgi:acyl-CoA oxidase
MPLALGYKIHGCYAQTEIGHGSNVAGLETTAVYNKENDEFVLNTPTITATKWWPGEMGTLANYALVFAQLVIEEDGERNSYGVAPFIVQIRDRDTHKHMPGIKTGDLGPKFGYHDKDNGWMTMDKVRIPRSHMLQRFIGIDEEGGVQMNGDMRALYTTMMFIRFLLIYSAKFYMAQGLTIALRYSVVRR